MVIHGNHPREREIDYHSLKALDGKYAFCYNNEKYVCVRELCPNSWKNIKKLNVRL